MRGEQSLISLPRENAHESQVLTKKLLCPEHNNFIAQRVQKIINVMFYACEKKPTIRTFIETETWILSKARNVALRFHRDGFFSLSIHTTSEFDEKDHCPIIIRKNDNRTRAILLYVYAYQTTIMLSNCIICACVHKGPRRLKSLGQ